LHGSDRHKIVESNALCVCACARACVGVGGGVGRDNLDDALMDGDAAAVCGGDADAGGALDAAGAQLPRAPTHGHAGAPHVPAGGSRPPALVGGRMHGKGWRGRGPAAVMVRRRRGRRLLEKNTLVECGHG
jgi:hypothetical protein